MKLVKGFFEKMAERDDYQNTAEGNERIASSKADDYQRTGNQLNYWDDSANRPERPRWQERVGVRLDEILSRVAERSHLKDLVHTGHEEDES